MNTSAIDSGSRSLMIWARYPRIGKAAICMDIYEAARADAQAVFVVEGALLLCAG
jgi:hypothetical protein